MKKYNYNVVLKTELGKKNGTMQILINNNKVEGFLYLLKHTEPICGNINADGSCSLQGKIVTLIKEFTYTATGYIGGEELRLNFKIGLNNYLLKGILNKE